MVFLAWYPVKHKVHTLPAASDPAVGGTRFRGLGLESRVWGLGFGIQGVGFRVQVLGLRVQNLPGASAT